MWTNWIVIVEQPKVSAHNKITLGSFLEVIELPFLECE